jgi:hypothetical protein
MRTPIWTRITVTALAVCAAAALAAPAAGQTLRRDGSKAVPLVADVSEEPADSSTGSILRRDGSKAVPFVADVGLDAVTAAPADGFDWGDAGLGAGVGALAVALAAVGAVSLRGRQVRARPNALS